MSVFEHPEAAKDHDAIKSFVGAIQALVRVEAERDALRAKVARVRALLPKWQADRATYPLDDAKASFAFLAVKACEEELSAAIDGTGF